MKKLPILLLGCAFFVALFRCKYEKETCTSDIKLKYGELIGISEDDDKVLIKAKIKLNQNNKITINQNGYNVKDLIMNYDFDKYSTINYLAICDMDDGSEAKIIEFTLNDTLIKAIKRYDIPASEILTYYAEDIHILPSLKY